MKNFGKELCRQRTCNIRREGAIYTAFTTGISPAEKHFLPCALRFILLLWRGTCSVLCCVYMPPAMQVVSEQPSSSLFLLCLLSHSISSLSFIDQCYLYNDLCYQRFILCRCLTLLISMPLASLPPLLNLPPHSSWRLPPQRTSTTTSARLNACTRRHHRYLAARLSTVVLCLIWWRFLLCVTRQRVAALSRVFYLWFGLRLSLTSLH